MPTPSPADTWRARVVCDPQIRHGEPVVRGTRIAVSTIVASVADLSIEAVLLEFPRISREDVQAALYFAAEASHNSMVA